MIIYIMLLLMTLLGATASFFLKKSSSAEDLKKMLLNFNLYIGGILYFLSALLNIYVLRYLDYSVVLPMTSITYVWTMVISNVFLKEKMTIKKIVGVMMIVIGAVLVAL